MNCNDIEESRLMADSDQPMPDTKPFLRWAGSKRQLLPILSKFWRDGYSRYVEPFAGSACLFFHLQPHRALLGDLNSELISTYESVKHQVDDVCFYLGQYKLGRDEYLTVRSIDPSVLLPAERAARFIYLNRFCFNGLYRTNQRGIFNVPYGGEKSGNLPTDEQLKRCSLLLKNVELFTGQFDKVLEQTKYGDFVYMDPPYRVSKRRVFNEYDPSSFSQEDLNILKEWLYKLDKIGIPFIVSYAESDEAIILGDGFHTYKVSVKRNIAGFTGHRGLANEILISNQLVSF